jgi:integrase
MATYRKRTGKDGTVTVHTMVRLAGYPTRTASFPNQREAQKWAATVEAEMIEGRHYKDANGRKRTLAEAIDRYRAEVLPLKRNGSMYGFTLDWWKANHGTRKLGEVTRGWLADCRGQLLSGTFTRATPGSKRSQFAAPAHLGTFTGTLTGHGPSFQRTPATANRYMAALSSVFTQVCGDWEWLQPGQNPFAGLSKLRESKGRVRHLSEEERSRLLQETAKDPQLHVLVLVALATAARAGELCGLSWACVELGETEGRLLFTDTKNGEARIAWVFGDALQALKDHAKARGVGAQAAALASTRHLQDPVFPGKWSHKQQGYGKYDYMPRFRKALTAAGITNFRFHDLRHTALTGLARMGMNGHQLKTVSGHKSDVINKYVHLVAEDTKAALRSYARVTQADMAQAEARTAAVITQGDGK